MAAATLLGPAPASALTGWSIAPSLGSGYVCTDRTINAGNLTSQTRVRECTYSKTPGYWQPLVVVENQGSVKWNLQVTVKGYINGRAVNSVSCSGDFNPGNRYVCWGATRRDASGSYVQAWNSGGQAVSYTQIPVGPYIPPSYSPTRRVA